MPVRSADRRFLLTGDRPPGIFKCTTTADMALRPMYDCQRGTFLNCQAMEDKSVASKPNSWPGRSIRSGSAEDAEDILIPEDIHPAAPPCPCRSSHLKRCPGLQRPGGKCGFTCLRKMKHHLRKYCHCDRLLWRQKTAGAMQPSSLSEVEADTAASQLSLLQSICLEVQGMFSGLPAKLRSDIMFRMQDVAKLVQVFKVSAEESCMPLRCPDWQVHLPSLQMATFMALNLSPEDESCEVCISDLHERNQIHITDTFGKRLVLRGGLDADAKHQKLTLDQFQQGALAVAGGRVDGTEGEWKAQLAPPFFDEPSVMLSFPHFVSVAKCLVSQRSSLLAPLGLTCEETVLANSSAVWKSIVFEDMWHRRTSQAGKKTGFVLCQSLHIGGNAHVELDNIHIHSTTQGERALVASGDASISLRGCRVSGCGNGIYLCNNASLSMADTDVCDCGSSGVVVANSSGTCHMESCHISNNRNVGVAIGGPKVTPRSCSFQNTVITGNENYGISLFGSASAEWHGPTSLLDGNGVAPTKLQSQPLQCKLVGFDD